MTIGATSKWVSSFVIITNPGNRRFDLFQAALREAGLPPARLVAYADLLDGRVTLPDVVRAGDIVRLDSPGKDFEVTRRLLAWGAEPAEREPYLRLTAAEVSALPFDKGRLLASRQWFLGFRRTLEHVGAQLDACPPHRRTHAIPDVLTMFDKPACHARLQAAGIPVPDALPPVNSFEELRAAMERAGWNRAFVKLAHGSSASGVVAYRFGPRGQQALTTVEMVGDAMYNTRRIRDLRRPGEIAALIDALCRHRVHVERWIPKATLGDRACDLRVVTIAGRARHTVVRLSHSPMTNLHLLNDRCPPDEVRERLGEARWAALRETCVQVAACFPESLTTGIDLLLTPDFRRHAVLEVNAFGDLLPGTLDAGQSTYAAEIAALVDGQ